MRSPSPDLLQLGRGIVRWAPIVAGVRKPWLDLGNVEQLTLATADTKLTKMSSRTGLNTVYKEITSEREVTLTIQGDEFSADVLAALLLGTASVVPATAGGNVVAEAFAAPGELDTIIELAHPLVSAVVITQTGAKTIDVDYEVVDAVRGWVRLIPVSEGGTMNPTAAFTVAYTWAAAQARTLIKAGTENVKEASIMFSADNAAGPNYDALFYRASLSSDGELGFISTDFNTWTLKCKLLDDSAGLFGGSTTSPLYKLTDAPVEDV